MILLLIGFIGGIFVMSKFYFPERKRRKAAEKVLDSSIKDIDWWREHYHNLNNDVLNYIINRHDS